MSPLLDRIISERRARLHNMALRIVGNHADAEDAVQDACLLAVRNFHQFRGDAKLSTWLTVIVLNSARMQLRRRKVHVSLDSHDGDLIPLSEKLADEKPSPETQFAVSQMEQQAARVIARLSPILHRTFHLRHVDGLLVREIASTLGVPVGTVKARLARAHGRVLSMRKVAA